MEAVLNIEHIKKLKQKEVIDDFLVFINRLDILAKSGTIPKIDKSKIYSIYKELIKEHSVI